jgi:hypothetical protein
MKPYSSQISMGGRTEGGVTAIRFPPLDCLLMFSLLMFSLLMFSLLMFRLLMFSLLMFSLLMFRHEEMGFRLQIISHL